jgi:hypothetical protein
MGGLDGKIVVSADGLQRGRPELTQDVIGAAGELAGDRQRRSGV